MDDGGSKRDRGKERKLLIINGKGSLYGTTGGNEKTRGYTAEPTFFFFAFPPLTPFHN